MYKEELVRYIEININCQSRDSGIFSEEFNTGLGNCNPGTANHDFRHNFSHFVDDWENYSSFWYNIYIFVTQFINIGILCVILAKY